MLHRRHILLRRQLGRTAGLDGLGGTGGLLRLLLTPLLVLLLGEPLPQLRSLPLRLPLGLLRLQLVLALALLAGQPVLVGLAGGPPDMERFDAAGEGKGRRSYARSQAQRGHALAQWQLEWGQHAVVPGHGLLPAAHRGRRVLVAGIVAAAGRGAGSAAAATPVRAGATAGTAQMRADRLRLRLQLDILSQFTDAGPLNCLGRLQGAQGQIRAAAQSGGLRLVQ